MNYKTATDTEIESVAKVLIVNGSREALVLILGEHKLYPEKSFLPDLPGGIVEQDESEKIAVIREAKEESNIDLNPDDVYLAYAKTEFFPKEKKSVSKFLYICTVENTPEVELSWEHSAHKWVKLDELLETTEFRPFFRDAIEYALVNNLV
jgi:8-oxo-dGTP pyrophosphatase MutT (NUDIX family)